MKTSHYVLQTLRKIARHGRLRPNRTVWGPKAFWGGFDDTDIQWFLRDFPHVDGPNFRKLRREHKQAITGDGTGKVVLYFWPFTKTQAKALLREIREAA